MYQKQKIDKIIKTDFPHDFNANTHILCIYMQTDNEGYTNNNKNNKTIILNEAFAANFHSYFNINEKIIQFISLFLRFSHENFNSIIFDEALCSSARCSNFQIHGKLRYKQCKQTIAECHYIIPYRIIIIIIVSIMLYRVSIHFHSTHT